MDNTDKVVVLIEECRQMKLVILPPTINVSTYRFTVNDDDHIVYGLGAIKGVGQSAIEDMLKERQKNGRFSGLYDLCKRIELRKCNRRVLEALIRAGAFDEFDVNRASHMAELSTALRVAEQHEKMAKTGQNDLFLLPSSSSIMVNNDDDLDDTGAYSTEVEPWSDNERLAAEKLTLGLFLTGHPIDQYEPELKHFTHGKIASLQVSRGNMEARVAGLVVEVRTRQTKQGKTMGFATIDDKSGRLECAAFGDVYEKYRGVFTRDSLLIAEGALAIDNFSGALRLTVEKLYDMDQAREGFSRGIRLTWIVAENNLESINTIERLREVLSPFKGGSCPISINYMSKVARAAVQLGDEWRVHPTDQLISRLKSLFGSTALEIRYR
jgi:DNA polymerase III subunit alpha